MTPFPFAYLPTWANFFAIWIGYSILLITVYCALMITLRWWYRDYRDEEMEHWERLTAEADEKVKRNLNN